MISELKSQIQKKESEIKELQKQVSESSAKASKNASKIADIQKKMADNLNSQSSYKAKKENLERQLENLEAQEKGDGQSQTRQGADGSGQSQSVEKSENDGQSQSGEKSENDGQSQVQPVKKTESEEQSKAQLIKEAEDATNAISRLEQEYRTLEQQLKQAGADSSGQDTSLTAADAAAQSLAQANQELEVLKTNLSQAENSSQISTDTSLTDAQLKNMQVSEDLAQLAELTAKELLEKGKEGIQAEFDGIISDVKVMEGSDAVQGGELFTLVSNQDVSVKLEVSAGDFDNLIIGEKAVITIGQHIYQGTLESIDKIALANEKGNPVIGAKLHIDDPDDDIYIGVSAKVNMTVAEKENALCLPNEVINTASDGDFVYVIRDGTVRKQQVEVGVTSASMSEIISGISEGDEVVSEISDNIEEGMKAAGVKEGNKETGEKNGE